MSENQETTHEETKTEETTTDKTKKEAKMNRDDQDSSPDNEIHGEA